MKQTKQVKKDLKKFDWMIGFAFVFTQFTRIFTNAYIAATSQASGATITAVTKLYEANPVAQLLLNMQGTKAILASLVIPATIIAVYWVYRRKVLKGKMDIDSLGYYTYMIFLIFFINFLSDAAILMGKLIYIN